MHLPYWPGSFSGRKKDFLRETLNLSALAPDPTGLSTRVPSNRDKALGCWLRLVTTYSLRSVTLQVDKLNALAGIAARCYAPLLGPGYFAGMWEYGLLRQLVWETTDFHESLPGLAYDGVTVTRPLLDSGLSRAPSWSWASVEGGMVKYDRLPNVKGDDTSRRQEVQEWMSEIVAVTTTPRFGMDNPFGEIEAGSGRITLRKKLRRAWWHPSSLSIFRKSCASTSCGRLSSPSEDYELSGKPISLSAAFFDERCMNLRGEDDRTATTETYTGEDDEEEWEDVDRSCDEENAEEDLNDVPTFDMITNQTVSGPFPVYISPFKRVLQRTGPLPPDSDSENDSMSETEETLVMPHTTDHASRYSRHRDHTWWWLVSASLDEINPKHHAYDA